MFPLLLPVPTVPHVMRRVGMILQGELRFQCRVERLRTVRGIDGTERRALR